jgi:hypothetical protein
MGEGEIRHEYLHNYGCQTIVIPVTNKMTQKVTLLPCIRVPIPAGAPTILVDNSLGFP